MEGYTRETVVFLRESKEQEFIVSYPELDVPVNRKHKELKETNQHQGHTPAVQSAGEKLLSTDQQYYRRRSGLTVK